MASQLAAAITAFAICVLTLPVIIKYSLKKNIGDEPGKRKVHKKVTPSMGGAAIFIGFLISSLIWIDIELWKEVRIILIALVMIFFIGVRDDLVPLRPITKILGQIMAALILILVYDLRLNSMYGLIGIYDIPLWLSYGITVLTIVVITNSYNLIDGLDGLAGTIGSIVLLGFGVWFFLVGDSVFSVISFSMVGALIAFLVFNWEPSKVFMGDTGTMVTGMLLAIIVIHFIDSNHNLLSGNEYKFTGSVSAAVCFIMIPLADTLRIFIVRMLKKQSPFKPDKNHLHHGIMRLGYSHSATTIILGVTQLTFIGFAVLFRETPEKILLPGVISLSIILSVILDRLLQAKISKQSRSVTIEPDEG
ncbi:MAG: undecaprenyl/decaprenyl-phosphate alpha-N-acetylglucosaminyl 1-phosphate transferase [Cyclobacteriaceae bacterium]|nr:undecaprenyl/decaprenyl-phosphate alpha-N-acetylglucosaminyl 1-phosphate transferase [Cyclobacteriaceae bacterium]